MELKLDTNKEYGLVLEGGGAKGAYQIGAWKALKEAGIHVKGIAGTSVGALNGALIAMDDFEKAERIWETIHYSRVMDVDDELVEQLKTSSLKDIAALGLSELIPAAKKVLKDRGFDIAPLRSLIEEVVDEEKIRNSEKELYVVTYSLSDRKPMVVNVKELPDGEIADMLMASAYLIGFRREKLGGKYYMDGGGVNNVPIDVLIEKGYKDILVFRIYGYGVDTERRLKVPDDVHLYHVAPRQDLGGLLEFDRRRARKNMVLGYFDAPTTAKHTGKKGRPKLYDGTIDFSSLDISRCTEHKVDKGKLYGLKAWSKAMRRMISLAVWYPEENSTDKWQLYFSTDQNQSAIDVLEYYRTRFQLEFCFRDSKQYAGITDCQSTDFRKLSFHFNASLTAINLAKAACKRIGIPYSISSCKSVIHNAYMLERFICVFGIQPDTTLIDKIFKGLILFTARAA